MSVNVGVCQPAAAGGDSFGGMAQEAGAIGIFPGVFAGRKVPSDVAFRERAVDGVAQRVDADIGVRVAVEPQVIWHFDAAEDELAPSFQRVDIETGADTGRQH